MKRLIKKWLGIDHLEENVSSIDDFLFDRDAKLQGFRIGRKHLLSEKEQRSFKWMGKPYKDKPDDR